MTTERMGVDPLESLAAWCNEKGIGQGEWARRSETYAVVAGLVRTADRVAYALTQDGRTSDGISKEAASNRLRAALRPFTGEQA